MRWVGPGVIDLAEDKQAFALIDLDMRERLGRLRDNRPSRRGAETGWTVFGDPTFVGLPARGPAYTLEMSAFSSGNKEV